MTPKPQHLSWGSQGTYFCEENPSPELIDLAMEVG